VDVPAKKIPFFKAKQGIERLCEQRGAASMTAAAEAAAGGNSQRR